ncbi:MAG: two-component sensor histidine kinase, partial [Chitinophagaceae bacterium]
MLKTKNLSPKQLSAFTAFILSVPIGLGIWVIEKSWLVAGAFFIVILFGSYLLIFSII